MDVYTYVLLGLLIGLYIYYMSVKTTPYILPPGPKHLPFFGSIFHVVPGKVHLQYTDMAKEYGDVFTVNMAGSRQVVLNSSAAIREALVSEETRDAFAGRPNNFFVKYCDIGPSTVNADLGDDWKRQRRLMMKTLKIHDGGKHSVETIIRKQLEHALEMLRDTGGKPFDIKAVIVPSLANILTVLINGEYYAVDHPALRTVMEFDQVVNRLLSNHVITILTIFPWLRFLPIGCGKLYKNHQCLFGKLIHYMMEGYKEKVDDQESESLVQTSFNLQRSEEWVTDDKIKGMCRETIGAGLGTTRSSLTTLFLILLHKPEVMRKIQSEIDDVICRKRFPTVEDKGHMPYTEAVTLELQRFVTIVPLSATHKTTRDVKFRGYFIPKDTEIITNLWAVHHDEAVWGDPWEFRPERFLDNKGRKIHIDSKERANWMPFGVGRRACLGETFARSRLFLFIVTLLQNFEFYPCEGDTLPPCDPRTFSVGMIVNDPKYNIRAIPRNI